MVDRNGGSCHLLFLPSTCSSNVLRVLLWRWRFVHRTFRERSGNVQGTFRERSEYRFSHFFISPCFFSYSLLTQKLPGFLALHLINQLPKKKCTIIREDWLPQWIQKQGHLLVKTGVMLQANHNWRFFPLPSPWNQTNQTIWSWVLSGLSIFSAYLIVLVCFLLSIDVVKVKLNMDLFFKNFFVDFLKEFCITSCILWGHINLFFNRKSN